jgi:hypothetical protein
MLMQCYEWYGTLWSCMACGDSWSDGERLERPFSRGWRAEKIAYLKKRVEQLKYLFGPRTSHYDR